MFLDCARDTTLLSNAAFAVLMLMANVSFSWSRAQHSPPEVQAKAVNVGEDFFLAAIIFAAASLTKYGLLHVATDPEAFAKPGDRRIWAEAFCYTTKGCFAAATVLAYLGFFHLGGLLVSRRHQP